MKWDEKRLEKRKILLLIKNKGSKETEKQWGKRRRGYKFGLWLDYKLWSWVRNVSVICHRLYWQSKSIYKNHICCIRPRGREGYWPDHSWQLLCKQIQANFLQLKIRSVVILHTLSVTYLKNETENQKSIKNVLTF